jgi:hypothetical protein
MIAIRRLFQGAKFKLMVNVHQLHSQELKTRDDYDVVAKERKVRFVKL